MDAKQKILENSKRRLGVLQQRAALTGISTSPETAIEIEDLQSQINNLEAELAESPQVHIERGLRSNNLPPFAGRFWWQEPGPLILLLLVAILACTTSILAWQQFQREKVVPTGTSIASASTGPATVVPATISASTAQPTQLPPMKPTDTQLASLAALPLNAPASTDTPAPSPAVQPTNTLAPTIPPAPTAAPKPTRTPTPTFTPEPPAVPAAAPQSACVFHGATDEATIIQIIEVEATAALKKNTWIIENIFDGSAVITDVTNTKTWPTPKARYQELFDTINFISVENKFIHAVDLKSAVAHFSSGSAGAYHKVANGEYGEFARPAGSNTWTLRKNDAGCWMITEFSFK